MRRPQVFSIAAPCRCGVKIQMRKTTEFPDTPEELERIKATLIEIAPTREQLNLTDELLGR